MLKKIFLILLFTTFITRSQEIVSGKMEPMNDEFTWVALYQLKGAKQIFINSSLIENGDFKIETTADIPSGMYRLVYKMDNKSSFDFIYSKNSVNVNLNPDQPFETLQFLNSNENSLYHSYQTESGILKEELNSIQMGYFKNQDKGEEINFKDLYDVGLRKFNEVQKKYELETKNTVTNHFIKAGNKYYASELVETPQVYLNSEKEHFFDFIDFNDKELWNSIYIIENVLNYVMYLNISEDDQVQKILHKNAINEVMLKAGKNYQLKSEIITTLLFTFSQSENVTMMDYLKDEFYNKLPDSVQRPEDIETIFDKVKFAVGKVAPNFEFKSNGKTNSLYNLKSSDIYVLAFWSTDCSHCLIEIPKLYEFIKEKEEIHTIAFALEKDELGFNHHTEKFTKWTNVLGLGKWENPTARMYEIYSTPSYFVLDANKKILAKPDTIEDLLDYFEN